MKKATFYSELAYVFGLLLLAFGTALTVYGGFGVSMVVAPAYILSEKVSFLTFGSAEYVLQGIILVIMMVILRKVRLTYFLSFITAVLYGLALNASLEITALIPANVWLQILLYAVGVVICAIGVCLFFRTYLPQEAYEMFVKEVSRRFNKDMSKFKWAYDFVSLAVAIVMALVLFGRLHGVGIGTVLTAAVFGPLINVFSKLFDKIFTFRDALPLRSKFED